LKETVRDVTNTKRNNFANLLRTMVNPRNTPPTPTKKAPSPTKRSPGKSYKPIPKKLQMKKAPTISVIHFGPPFAFELYFYEKSDTDDAFTYGIIKQIRGEQIESHHLFDNANFVQVLPRRVPGSADVPMQNGENNYDRRLFLRYPPEEESTKTTREKGLHAIKTFLQDKRFSKFPPSEIDIQDLTNHEDKFPRAMDDYMMNTDIKAAIEQACDPDDLDENFKTNFPDCAKCIWRSDNVGEFGKSLGF
jgi:hypothetical protein